MMMTGWMSPAAVVLFFIALWTPLIGMFWGGRLGTLEENRRLAPWPKLGPNTPHWLDLGGPFTAYLHDHFGFRGTLITGQALFRVRLLGVSTSPEVMLGQNGWLFYSGEKSLDNHLGVLPFHPDELTGWVQCFKKRNDWFAKRGILMVVAIVPDKQSIYPEFLPSAIRKVSEQTRLDAFVAAMRRGSNVPVLDLRRGLLDAKTRHSYLYFATDTHWNSRGAYAAYVEILSEIAKKYPDVHPMPWSNMQHGNINSSGDLARMLGLGNVWREEMDYPITAPALRISTTSGGDLVVRKAAAANPRLVIFGDSFSSPLVSYLAEHFGETVVTQSVALKPALIDEHTPDVVLFEMVERKLNNSPPEDP